LIRPYRDRIHVTRLDGHGIERTTPGGIVIPATVEKDIRTKQDCFRARVNAVGDEADRELQGDLKPGDEVLVYTYAAEDAKYVFTGGDYLGKGARDAVHLFVKPADLLAVVGP